MLLPPTHSCSHRSDAADAATAEKQISLLTRGLTHHPSSPALLLALLRAYAVVAPDAAALAEKWRGVLARQGGSWLLWREFLAQQYVAVLSFVFILRCEYLFGVLPGKVQV
jgi:hypothetical protein